jgi:hypothetical protein
VQLGAKRLDEATKHKDFNELLLEAIDAAFSSLGESPKSAIYFALADRFNIQRHEIPNRLEDFTCALEKIFKDGAKCLNILFLKNLNAKLEGNTINSPDLHLANQELPFQGCVKLIRQNFENGNV